MNTRLLMCGEHAVLVEMDTLEEVLDLDLAVRAAIEAGDPAFANVVDVVPAARTLLVVVHDGTEVMPVRTALTGLPLPAMSPTTVSPTPTTSSSRTLSATALSAPTLSPSSQSAGSHGSPPPGAPGTTTPSVVEILVRYDGPDLDEVAGLTGLSVDEVVAAHTQTPWRVAFAGFAPGFAYLTGGDPRLRVPRRREPRTSVPAGSVGLAGEFSAVYPRSSPGGWQLLGHTDAVLWDVDRQPPALLRSGSLVRFVNADNDDSDDSDSGHSDSGHSDSGHRDSDHEGLGSQGWDDGDSVASS